MQLAAQLQRLAQDMHEAHFRVVGVRGHR